MLTATQNLDQPAEPEQILLAAATAAQKRPISIGRIVIFRYSKDLTYPALVVYVVNAHYNIVHLQVFTDMTPPLSMILRKNISMGDKISEWRWSEVLPT